MKESKLSRKVKLPPLQNSVEMIATKDLLRDDSPKKQGNGQQKQEKKESPQKQPNPSTDQVQKNAGFLSLFRFAQPLDYVLMAVGAIIALGLGGVLPAASVLWTDAINAQRSSVDAMVDQALKATIKFIYIGIGAFVAGWLMVFCWTVAGQRQSVACKKAYLKSILTQQVSWFERKNSSGPGSTFFTELKAFEAAIGENMSSIFMGLGILIASIGVAFYTDWLLNLISAYILPIIGLTGYLYFYGMQSIDQKSKKDYKKAKDLTVQALSAIQTVKQLNGEEFQTKRYKDSLSQVISKSRKHSLMSGSGIGALLFSMLAFYSIGLWFDSNCIEGILGCDQSISTITYSSGFVLVQIFSILMAGFNLSRLIPSIKKMSQGQKAATRIFELIDKKPLIQNLPNAFVPQEIKGVIKFQCVTFSYPNDRSKKVLDNISFEFRKGSTGLVGIPAYSKQAICQLIMRFYQPDSGKITFDEVNIKQIDKKWLRQNIGYICFQPILLNTTIKENIMFGKEDSTEDQVIHILKNIQADDLIEILDKKVQAQTTQGMNELTARQKKIIQIARVLMKNPIIILLNQTLSQLSPTDQKFIQKTLDKISRERTTLNIGNQFKDIVNCDFIYILKQGKLKQKGKFNELKCFNNITYRQKIKQNLKQFIIDNEFKITGSLDLINTKSQEEFNRQNHQGNILLRLLSYASESKLFFIIGFLVALLNGLVMPVFSIFLPKMLTILFYFNFDKEQARKDFKTYSIAQFILGIIALVLNIFQFMIVSSIGQTITNRIRIQTYNKTLKMPLPWFENPKNKVDNLIQRLDDDCKNVKYLIPNSLMFLIQNLAFLIASIIIAFLYEWRTTLVTLGLLSIVIILKVIQTYFTNWLNGEIDTNNKQSQLILKPLMNIRPFSFYGKQNAIFDKYESKLETPFELIIKKGTFLGLLFGLSKIAIIIIFALILYLATIFMRDNPNLTLNDAFTAIYAITLSVMAVYNNYQLFQSISSVKSKAVSLFQILDSEDEEQKQARQKSKMLKSGIKGHFQLRNIQFRSQTNNDDYFQDLNLSLDIGKKISFLHHQSRGNATILKLLLRFYEPNYGQILLDGVDIKDYEIHYLRSCIGVIDRDPAIFNGNFKENIIYNMEKVNDQNIMDAAMKANALDFIQINEKVVSLEDQKKQKLETPVQTEMNEIGFNKNVGPKSCLISHDQKQRIAIARTILRNPPILFFNDANANSESINNGQTQDTIKQAMKNRTSISVTDKIENLKSSDEIIVIDKGCVVEKGSPKQLLNNNNFKKWEMKEISSVSEFINLYQKLNF